MGTLVLRDDPGVHLMLRVQRDDAAAFGELVRLFSPTVFARFVRIFRDRQEAEDLTQEVLLRLYRSRKGYQPRARFNTWLFHITQNVARNRIRTRRRRVQLHFGLDQDDESMPDPGLRAGEMPWLPLERRETRHIVRGAVSSLRGKQRRALEMHQFQHRSYREIARALELSAKATKSLLYRARVQLRQVLERQRHALV